MNPMHAGNAQRIGCTAAKNSGFGTVGMHDVWLVLLQHAFQRKKTLCVSPRMQTAPHFRHEFQVETTGNCALFQSPLGT